MSIDIHDEVERQLARAPDMLHMQGVYGINDVDRSDIDRLVCALGGDSELTIGSVGDAYHYLMLLVIKRMIGPKREAEAFNAHIVGIDPDQLFKAEQLGEIIEHMNSLINSKPEGDK